MLVNTPQKDSITASLVSIDNIRLYNHAIVDLDACNELADSLYSEIQNNELSRKQKDEAIIIYNSMISNLENQVKEKEITEESYKKEAKINSNKTKLFKGLLNLVSAVAIVEMGVIIKTNLHP